MNVTPAQRAEISQMLAEGATVLREWSAYVREHVEKDGEYETVAAIISAMVANPKKAIDTAVCALMHIARTEVPQ